MSEVSRTWRMAVAVIVVAVAGIGAAVYHRGATDPLPIMEAAPDFELLNQEGHPVRLSQLEGKVKLLTFIYVRCSVATQCPLTTQNFRGVQERMEQAGAADRTVFLSVTFDPNSDSPATLKGYGELYGADFGNWHFLTADEPTIDQICHNYSIIHERTVPNEPDIRHSVLAYLIDGQNRIRRVYFANSWKPETAADDLLALLKEEDRR